MTTPDDAVHRLRQAIRDHHTDHEAWTRVGEQFRDQRARLSPRYADNRRLFIRERGLPRKINEKFAYDLEGGPRWGRQGFGAEKMLAAAAAYSVDVASVADALVGGHLRHVEPEPADRDAAGEWMGVFRASLTRATTAERVAGLRSQISPAVARNVITPRMADEMSERADQREAEIAVTQMETGAPGVSRPASAPPAAPFGDVLPEPSELMERDLEDIRAEVYRAYDKARAAHPGVRLTGLAVFPRWPAAAGYWDALAARGWDPEQIPAGVSAALAMDVQDARGARQGNAGGLTPPGVT